MYENQEIIWYNKDYSNVRPNENTGVISGRYKWLLKDLDYDLTNYIAVDVTVSSFSTNGEISCSSIQPSEDLHLYDKTQNKSWSSVVEFVLNSVDYAGHENEYDLNNCILVDSFSNVEPKQSGVYYYTVNNGVVTMKVSAENGSYYFVEDDSYSARGFEIYNTVVTKQNDIITNIAAGIYPAQALALVTSSNKYISNYIPIILVSDFGYDIQGGNKIDVSRLDSLGNIY